MILYNAKMNIKVKKATKLEIEAIKSLFLEHYPDGVTELDYTNIYELLISVMLSAQCTDKRVNIITPALFCIYPTSFELANANVDDIKLLINSCSFFNVKAENLIKMARSLVENFGGEVPLNQKDLMSLAGVGQKTANVVLSEYLGANCIAVDTHVFRVAHRLGLSDAATALKTEDELTKKFKTQLHLLHQAMVIFGRYHCKAINPQCGGCFLAHLCKSNGRFKV